MCIDDEPQPAAVPQPVPQSESDLAQMERMPIVVTGTSITARALSSGGCLRTRGRCPRASWSGSSQCERNAKPFEYAFLLDALKDEQAQGITIDSARVFFKSAKRDYIIIDAPGHIEFLKNMVTGAARADAALLVIDAREGIQENSRRHGYLLSMLGIRQIAVVVNKMDLVGFDAAGLRVLRTEYAGSGSAQCRARRLHSCQRLSWRQHRRPVAAMPWYEGPTVLETLDDFQRATRGEPAVPHGGSGRLQVHPAERRSTDHRRHDRHRRLARR